MNAPPDEKTADGTLERRSRELFDEQVANLDARTRSRLNQVRQAALTATGGAARNHAGWSSRWWLPVGSAAVLALVGLSTLQFLRADREAAPSDAPRVMVGTVDDVEILTFGEELEMLQNVDFYAWLDTQPDGLQDDLSTASAPSEAG